MRVRGWRWTVALLLAMGAMRLEAQGSKGACRRVVVEGEVAAGKGFERVLGGGLKVMLEPLASGWILRVLPAVGPRGQHDYAELATPPYQSVTPLLIGTDYSFRAQDAVAWNPRRFRYAASAAEFAGLAASYAAYQRTSTPQLEADLGGLAARAPEGMLEILDARLVPGTANQAQTAAMVASHFATTAHTVEQPADGKGSPLGKVTWMRFRIGFSLPSEFHPDKGLTVERAPCP